MKKIFLLLFFCAALMQSVAAELDKRFQIIPQPQQVEVMSGKGLRHNELTHILVKAGAEVPVLQEMLDKLPRAPRAGRAVVLQLSDAKDVPQSPEGYVLQVNNGGVSIMARTETGLFYGCQTLEQLMEDSRDFGVAIPAMRITDYPKIAYRAVHFDVKHHLDRTEYYYRLIDKLARYKVNAVIWEIEDKLKYERRPEIASPNAISKQEMQALCRYAKERNVEISPLVQGLGHASFILKHHWELRENPASDWEFCPSDERTYDLQFDLYKDALEAMPYGKYLHVGGDEITAIGIDERCKATGKTPFELQMIWLKRVCDFAVAHNRTPIFWDDMPLKYGNVWDFVSSKETSEEVAKRWNSDKLDQGLSLFPKECVYMRWLYGDPTTPGHQQVMRWYGDAGLKVMGATEASYGDSPFMPRKNSHVGDIKSFSTLVAENHLEGILATAWDDGSAHLETVTRGFIAQGEYGWNPTGRTIEAYKTAHAQREYGFAAGEKRMLFLDELEEAAYFFDDALITSGRRNPCWGVKEFTLIDLPEVGTPGFWSEKNAEKVAKAKEEKVRYEQICSGLKRAQGEALRNRYTLKIYEQNNNLFYFPARLILALHAYDMAASDNDRAVAKQEIRTVCQSFDVLRRELVAEYSKTRFMHQPNGYVSDLNHHNHLAAKANDDSWQYYYELPMIEKVMKWLGE